MEEALRLFFEVREVPGIKKKPSTSELLDWLKLLLTEDIGPETLRERDPRKLIPPLHGALLKNEQDVSLFEKLAFMVRRESAENLARAALAWNHAVIPGQAEGLSPEPRTDRVDDEALASWHFPEPSSVLGSGLFAARSPGMTGRLRGSRP